MMIAQHGKLSVTVIGDASQEFTAHWAFSQASN